MLAFITNHIPNVGFLLGLVPPALIAVLEGGVADGILVVVVYTVLNVVIQTIIQPRFTGDAVGLTATVAFLSLLFWSVILGPLGALLAIPATSFVKAALVDADPSARWINAFIAIDHEDKTAPPGKDDPRGAKGDRAVSERGQGSRDPSQDSAQSADASEATSAEGAASTQRPTTSP